MLTNNPQNSILHLGDIVIVKESHFVEELIGRKGVISAPPPKIVNRAGDYYKMQQRANGVNERQYWVVFVDVEPLQPGDIDAGMIPESDLSVVS